MKIQIILWIVIGLLSPVSLQDFVSEMKNYIPCCRIEQIIKASNETTDRPMIIDKSLWFGTMKFHSKANATKNVTLEESCTSNFSDEDDRPNCQCHYGWRGTFCNESLFCAISKPHSIVSRSVEDLKRLQKIDHSTGADKDKQGSQDFINEQISINNEQRVNPSRIMTSSEAPDIPDSKIPASYGMTSEAVIIRLQNQWKNLPNCKPECLITIDKSDFNHVQIEYMNYYVIPIDSICNRETAAFNSEAVLEFLRKYQFYFIGAAIGIILFVMTVCILCVRRKKRKTQNTNENGIPMVPNQQNYMKNNLIYNS